MDTVKNDPQSLFNTSYYLLRNRQYKTALEGLKICWVADSANLGTIAYTPMAYILNDQYEPAKRILEKWKNEPLNVMFPTYADGFRSVLSNLEGIGIRHPDFEKAKKLLEK